MAASSLSLASREVKRDGLVPLQQAELWESSFYLWGGQLGEGQWRDESLGLTAQGVSKT